MGGHRTTLGEVSRLPTAVANGLVAALTRDVAGLLAVAAQRLHWARGRNMPVR